MSDNAELMVIVPLAILIISYFVLPDEFVDSFLDIVIALFKAIFGFEDDGSLNYLFEDGG